MTTDGVGDHDGGLGVLPWRGVGILAAVGRRGFAGSAAGTDGGGGGGAAGSGAAAAARWELLCRHGQHVGIEGREGVEGDGLAARTSPRRHRHREFARGRDRVGAAKVWRRGRSAIAATRIGAAKPREGQLRSGWYWKYNFTGSKRYYSKSQPFFSTLKFNDVSPSDSKFRFSICLSMGFLSTCMSVFYTKNTFTVLFILHSTLLFKANPALSFSLFLSKNGRSGGAISKWLDETSRNDVFWILHRKRWTQKIFFSLFSSFASETACGPRKNMVFEMGWTWVVGSTWDFSEAKHKSLKLSTKNKATLQDKSPGRYHVTWFKVFATVKNSFNHQIKNRKYQKFQKMTFPLPCERGIHPWLAAPLLFVIKR